MNKYEHFASKLKPGAWFSVNYGFTRIIFCVLEIVDGNVKAECRSFLYSSSKTFTIRELCTGWFNPKFMWYGSPRFFMGRIRRWLDCWGTIYSLPPRNIWNSPEHSGKALKTEAGFEEWYALPESERTHD